MLRPLLRFLKRCVGFGAFGAPLEQLNSKRFYTKVRGVTWSNADGVSRQDLVRRCRRGHQLRLEREPDNPADPFAIKVCMLDGRVLGYISADTAAWLHDVLDRGGEYRVTVTQLTGKKRGVRGLNIRLERVRGG